MPSEPTTAEPPVVYAIGDVHGQDALLARLHAGIVQDARRYAGRDRALVHLGDYVDRGPHPRKVLARVRAGLKGFRCVALRGNHEQMMLEAAGGRDVLAVSNWLLNGGGAVLADYGIRTLSPLKAMQELAAAAADDIAWMATLPYTHREGPYLFVHAGIAPGRPLDRQRPQDLIWIRDRFLSDRRDHGLIVVHGHTPRSDWPEVENNRIGIDTGAAHGGPLTAAVLDLAVSEPRFLQARPR